MLYDGTLLASYLYLAQRIVRLHSRWVVPFLYYSWNISRSRCCTTTPSTSSLLPIERASELWHSRCEALDGGALRRDARNVDFFYRDGPNKKHDESKQRFDERSDEVCAVGPASNPSLTTATRRWGRLHRSNGHVVSGECACACVCACAFLLFVLTRIDDDIFRGPDGPRDPKVD